MRLYPVEDPAHGILGDPSPESEEYSLVIMVFGVNRAFEEPFLDRCQTGLPGNSRLVRDCRYLFQPAG